MCCIPIPARQCVQDLFVRPLSKHKAHQRKVPFLLLGGLGRDLETRKPLTCPTGFGSFAELSLAS